MIPSFLNQKESTQFIGKPGKYNLSFIDNTVNQVSKFILNTLLQHVLLKKNGLLQKTDNRIKILFLFLSLVIINLLPSITGQFFISLVLFILFILSQIRIWHIYKRILIVGVIFGVILFLPASINIITPGTSVLKLFNFRQPQQWWIYSFPAEITVTREGLYLVAKLSMRVINSVSVVLLLLFTTTFEQLIKSLAYFKVPSLFILTLTLSYKFIFVLSQTIEESYKALKMRWWNRGKRIDADTKIAGRIGFVFRKSMEKYNQTYNAMLARGFTGSVKIKYTGKLQVFDIIFCMVIIGVYSVILIFSL